MFNKIAQIFKSQKETPEQAFMQAHGLSFDPVQGYSIDGVVLNDLAPRLKHFSNRSLEQFDDLKALFYKSIMINEKIDLEIANQRFNASVGNTEENLKQFKQYLAILNDYYRQFKRER